MLSERNANKESEKNCSANKQQFPVATKSQVGRIAARGWQLAPLDTHHRTLKVRIIPPLLCSLLAL